jgi:hypothetical protein
MEIAKIVLSYMQVLLNWPFLGACLIFIFIFTFKERIEDFLARLVKGKVGAVSSGFYQSPSGKYYPKIQILTIRRLTL